jgi:hypothetical protein
MTNVLAQSICFAVPPNGALGEIFEDPAAHCTTIQDSSPVLTRNPRMTVREYSNESVESTRRKLRLYSDRAE